MASTNSYLHADAELPEDLDDVESPAAGGARKRGAGKRIRGERRKSRNSLRKIRATASESSVIAGWPAFDGIKPVLSFLAIPAFLVLAITITGGHWPKFILYPIALGLGAVVAVSAFTTVELVLAVLLIYLPFSKVFVVPIAPGINGTNMLVLLGLFASFLRLIATRQKLTEFPAGTYLVFAFALLTSLSAFTITQYPGGRAFLLYNEFLSYKGWVDQFIFYFIVLMCVRDIESAKRTIVYVMIGSVLVVLYSVPEMLEKAGRSTIEKSRIGGPHLQSNNFGGFVAYTVLPLIALFAVYIKDIRAWILTPYFLITAKVLITSFSRGAYVAMVVGGFLVAWMKGKGFLAWWAAVGISIILVFPSVIPEAILARFDTGSSVNSAATAEEKLDKSSATRLIMWRAAAKMIEEDPIWGKGFKGFPFLKDNYVEVPVEESDPHNMYLYIGSQMGLPSLALYLVILGYSFWLGRSLSQNREDRFIRVIGIGGAAATACFAVVCIFGSRAVSLNFTAYFWTFLVAMQVIRQKQLDRQAAENPRRQRTNAFKVARQEEDQAENDSLDVGAENGLLEHHGADEHASRGWQRSGSRRGLRGATRGAAVHQAAQDRAQHANTQQPVVQPPAQDTIDEMSLPSALKRKSRRKRKRFPSI